jgi:Zn-dependent peptidase ImmA (M78 family)
MGRGSNCLSEQQPTRFGRNYGNEKTSSEAVGVQSTKRSLHQKKQKATKAAEREASAKRQDDAKIIIKELQARIARFSQEDYQAWLVSLPTMYQYSWLNNLLLLEYGQLSGISPSRVKSMKAWNEDNRRIKKGSKGLGARVPRQLVKKDRDGKPLLDKNGEKVVWTQFPVVFRFYDISQTELMPGCEDASQEHQGAQQAIKDLTRVAERNGIVVHSEAAEANHPHAPYINPYLLKNPGVYGAFIEFEMTDSEEPSRTEPVKAIVLRGGLDPTEQARVLAHELAHGVMHNREQMAKEGDKDSQKALPSKQQKEVEAETVAYVIMSDYQLASEFSVPYIHGWAGSNEDQRSRIINQSTERIRLAAKDIFGTRDRLEAEMSSE